MKDIFVRKAEPRDIPLLAHWLHNSPFASDVDATVFAYPNTQVYVAHRDKPVGMLPLQLTMTVESFAYPPDASDTQKAAALAQLIKTAVFIAREKQIAEIFFNTTDEHMATFAAAHGFREMGRSFRLRLSDLESAT
jgi:hypothetical protein